MKNTFTYKDFIGSIQYDSEDKIFFRKIEGINDLVTFEGKSEQELKKYFEEAVDDYIGIKNEIFH